MIRERKGGRTERQTVALTPNEQDRLAAVAAALGVAPAVAGRLAMVAGLALLEGERRQLGELAEAQAAILAAIEKNDAAMRAGVGSVYKAVRALTPGGAVPGQR